MQQAKITELFDFRELTIPHKLLEVKVPRSKIKAMLDRAARRYLRIMPEEGPIQPGDIAIVDLESSDPALQRKEQHINVRMGFFIPEVESVLTGMKCGEEMAVTVKGSDVRIYVRRVFRRYIPELEDAHIPPLHIEGVSTEAEYRQYVFDQVLKIYKGQKKSGLAQYVKQQILERSVFDIPEEMVDRWYAVVLDNIRKNARVEEDKPLAEFLPEAVTKQIHRKAETVEEAVGILREECWKDIAVDLVARHYAEQNGVSFNRETYLAKCREIAEQSNVSLAEVKYPYEDYLRMAPKWYLETEYLPNCYNDQFTIIETED